jgi:proton-dependent oligopeptide transporter, POT family
MKSLEVSPSAPCFAGTLSAAYLQQINNNVTSQAAVMKLSGVPNDILSHVDPFVLLILIPVFDFLVYSGIRNLGINFSPIKKITCGFYTGAAAMVWACVIQACIYKDSPCRNHAADPDCEPTSINVWAQTGLYVLMAMSEIFACISAASTPLPKLLPIYAPLPRHSIFS